MNWLGKRWGQQKGSEKKRNKIEKREYELKKGKKTITIQSPGLPRVGEVIEYTGVL